MLLVRLQLLLFLSKVFSAPLDRVPTSYSVGGKWDVSGNPDLECSAHHLCSASNKTWIPAQPAKLFDSVTGCAALLARNISQIHFHGDSFMRQIYAAMLITLNGNFRNGSVGAGAGGAGCTFNRQFEEKRCGVRQLNHYGIVCGGRVILDPLLTGLHSLDACSRQNGTIALLSFGNYKIGPYGGRVGVNNATSYQDFFSGGLCPLVRARHPGFPASAQDAAQAALCRVVWVSTHARLRAHFPDEAPNIIQRYNEDMRAFYDAGRCGPVGYVDVFNMTAGLIAALGEESKALSYDHVHWGMEVNLLKAQILLNAILS